MRKITTNQGDTWDIVSWREYGTEKKIAELIEANPEHRMTVIFPADVTLSIPEVETARDAPAPPWRRRNG